MSALENFLFDTPYWLLGLIAIAAAALLVAGNNRQDRRLVRAGLGALALAVLLGVTSFLVDTDREKVLKGTRRLVDAVERQDAPAIAALLHPDVAAPARMNKDTLVSEAVAAAKRYQLKSLTVLSLEAQELGVDYTTTFRVNTRSSAGVYENVPSDWQLVWTKSGDTWQVKQIKSLSPMLEPYIGSLRRP